MTPYSLDDTGTADEEAAAAIRLLVALASFTVLSY